MGLFVPKAERHAHTLSRYSVYWLVTIYWNPPAFMQAGDRLYLVSRCQLLRELTLKLSVRTRSGFCTVVTLYDL